MKTRPISRRGFLQKGAASAAAFPLILNSRAFGANDRIVMGFIGMGGQGRSDMLAFLQFPEVQGVAVCDVVDEHTTTARNHVNGHYGNEDCATYRDWRDIVARDDIDAVFIGTPDHWHAVMTVAAMKAGKDVYCEKPETLTVREGRVMADVAHRYGRVFSGGSQRVWGDYEWFHKMVHGGRIGEPEEAWVNVGGPSGPCDHAYRPVPPGVDWDMWLGPAPWRPYEEGLTKGGFRPFRDYSGGGMTDWGCPWIRRCVVYAWPSTDRSHGHHSA